MSARARLERADELFEEALAVPLTGDDAADEPQVEQIVKLLAALVAMTGAHAAALIEANEHPLRVVNAAEVAVSAMPPRPGMISETRPYAGG